MRGWRGLAAGVLGLTFLELLTQSDDESKVTGLLGFPAAAARWLISPKVALIPNLNKQPVGQTATNAVAGGISAGTAYLSQQPIRTVPKYSAPLPQVAPPASIPNTPVRIH